MHRSSAPLLLTINTTKLKESVPFRVTQQALRSLLLEANQDLVPFVGACRTAVRPLGVDDHVAVSNGIEGVAEGVRPPEAEVRVVRLRVPPVRRDVAQGREAVHAQEQRRLVSDRRHLRQHDVEVLLCRTVRELPVIPGDKR